MSSNQTPRAAVPYVCPKTDDNLKLVGREHWLLIDNETGGGIEARVRHAIGVWAVLTPEAGQLRGADVQVLLASVLAALCLPATTTTTEARNV